MSAFYYGLGFFILTSVTIAVAGIFGIHRWMPIPVGVIGIFFLFYGSVLMLRETRMATATINAEMDFTWRLAKNGRAARNYQPIYDNRRRAGTHRRLKQLRHAKSKQKMTSN